MKSRTLFATALVLAVAGASGSPAHAGSNPFRRHLDNGKTVRCETVGSSVRALISNQDVQFDALPVDAQYTLNYIDNGVESSDGPFTVEQTSGTLSYGGLSEPFASYPFTFTYRLDTIVDGNVVYRSSISVNCTADTEPVAAVIVNEVVPPDLPDTGAHTGSLLAFATMLVAAGAVAMGLGRRRSTC